jgi:hypothetical protein
MSDYQSPRKVEDGSELNPHPLSGKLNKAPRGQVESGNTMRTYGTQHQHIRKKMFTDQYGQST